MTNFYVEDLYAQKIADISMIPVEYILKARDLGILNEQNSRNMLIRYDCLALLKTKKFTAPQIYERLAGIYNMSIAQVQRIVKLKPERILYCKKCGCQITKSTFKKNEGMCRRCISQQSILGL